MSIRLTEKAASEQTGSGLGGSYVDKRGGKVLQIKEQLEQSRLRRQPI